ncbi:hypothetical protein FXB39_00620 [Nocardioides sp. BGMRC 2183]|nr:hypothetical protein FXB39_00620 [Nocardioides sp. BGMRC 2183]
MKIDPKRVEPADTTYPDWHGTTTAEDSFIAGSADLYDMAGLKDEDWTILGLEISGFSHGEKPTWDVRVYAHDRRTSGANEYQGLKELEAERGAIPVKEILLHEVNFEDVVRSMKLVGMQFLRRHFDNLEVVELGDHPPQG